MDISTLNALRVLSADTLYSIEVAQLPKLSREEEKVLVARARAGDQEARHALVESCLSYALDQARFLYYERQPFHDDLLDLAQEASMDMVAKLDRALEASRPAGYLRGIAHRAISRYCTYRTGLIQKPRYPLAVVKKRQHPTTVEDVESLDKLIYGKPIRVDLISAPEPPPEPDERRHRARYAVLYQALKKSLSRRERSVIIQLYGLYGQPVRTAREIDTTRYAPELAYKARKKLGKYLEKHLARMLAPKPKPEEA